MFNFHEVRFPEQVSWGSHGGPRFRTQLFVSMRGFEKRNIDWAQPMMEFNAAMGVQTDVQMAQVLTFFNAREGMANGFRYKNWANYRVNGLASPWSGVIAVGNGVDKRLPMFKLYGEEHTHMYKRLQKIVIGTVVNVRVLVEPQIEGTDFTIDYNSGEIIFNTVVPNEWPVYCDALEFDEAVRFNTDNMQATVDQFNSQSLQNLPLITFRGEFTAGSAFAPSDTASGTDDFYSFTTMILNFDGTEGQTTTVDQSVLALPVTFTGSASLSRLDFRHGLSSLTCGTGGVHVTGGSMRLGFRPFTLEVFAKKPTTGADIQPIIAQWDETGAQRGWTLRYNSVLQRLQFVISNDGTTEKIVLQYPWDPVDPTAFEYIVVERMLNGWFNLRIAGTLLQTARDITEVNASTAVVNIGRYVDVPVNHGSFQGLIDSVRMTVGRARFDDFEDVTEPSLYPVA